MSHPTIKQRPTLIAAGIFTAPSGNVALIQAYSTGAVNFGWRDQPTPEDMKTGDDYIIEQMKPQEHVSFSSPTPLTEEQQLAFAADPEGVYNSSQT